MTGIVYGNVYGICMCNVYMDSGSDWLDKANFLL